MSVAGEKQDDGTFPTIYLGSRETIQFTFYDKLSKPRHEAQEVFDAKMEVLKELRYGGGMPSCASRFEVRLRGKWMRDKWPEVKTVEQLFSALPAMLEYVFAELFRIVDAPVDRDNGNQKRAKMNPFWGAIRDAVKLSKDQTGSEALLKKEAEEKASAAFAVENESRVERGEEPLVRVPKEGRSVAYERAWADHSRVMARLRALHPELSAEEVDLLSLDHDQVARGDDAMIELARQDTWKRWRRDGVYDAIVRVGVYPLDREVMEREDLSLSLDAVAEHNRRARLKSEGVFRERDGYFEDQVRLIKGRRRKRVAMAELPF